MTQLYHELEDGHFRLLSFNDSTDTACQLNSYDIDRAPPYIALSYTWGAATTQQETPRQEKYHISINGEQAEVQQNLHDALSNLAAPIRRQKCLLWVDAICIDQANFEERNAQVRRMKEIYEKANHVFAWLGMPHNEDEIRLAIDFMLVLELYLRDAREKHNNDTAVAVANLRKRLIVWLGEKDIELRKAWQGISNMFNRPYWERTWIYQEVTTPTNIQFWCGRYKFDESSFAAAMIFSICLLGMPGFVKQFMEGTRGRLTALRSFRDRSSRKASKQRRLVDLLIRIRTTSCMDPRDKVYALLGHAADVTSDQLPIDYHKSLADLYVDVVKLYVLHKENPTLDILGHVFTLPDDIARKGWNNSTMPSWIPDWRQRNMIRPIHTGRSAATYPYDPCPGTTIEAHIMDGTLQLRGIVMEDLTIEILTDWWHDIRDFTTLSIVRRWYNDFMANGDASLDEPIRRALVGNGSTSVFDNQNVGHAQGDRMVDWGLVDMDNAQLERLGYKRKRRAMVEDVENFCCGKRMAMLTNRSIAIVPAGSMPDDQVALFHGGKALYVLRPVPGQQNTFRFIGECYVNDLMDGALMELNAQRGRTAGLVRMV